MNNTKTRIIEFWFSFRHLQGSVQPGYRHGPQDGPGLSQPEAGQDPHPASARTGWAMVQRPEKFDEETGRIVTQKRLVAVSKPEVHARVHSSENSAIIACSLVVQMKDEVAYDGWRMRWVTYHLFIISGEIKRLVLDRELHGKVKMAEVLAALPMKVETTLSRCWGIGWVWRGGCRGYKRNMITVSVEWWN